MRNITLNSGGEHHHHHHHHHHRPNSEVSVAGVSIRHEEHEWVERWLSFSNSSMAAAA
jgi:hypothetical protein